MEQFKTADFDITDSPIGYAEVYRYVRVSESQLGIGEITPENGKPTVILHWVATEFRPVSEGEGIRTEPQRKALVSLEMTKGHLEALHDLVGRYLRHSNEDRDLK